MKVKLPVKKLDLGCGLEKVDGADGLDMIDLPGLKYKHDMNRFPYPIKPNTYDEIHCYHILEHVDDVIRVMEEVYRIGKHNAKIYIRSPHASCSKVLWADPTHKRAFSTRTFIEYFSSGGRWSYYTKANFHLENMKINYTFDSNSRIPRVMSWFLTYIANINLFSQELCERLWANWFGGFEEISVILRVNKSNKSASSL